MSNPLRTAAVADPLDDGAALVSSLTIDSEVLPLYPRKEHTSPAKNVSIGSLAFALTLGDVPVGPKDGAPVLTPYLAGGKTKDHARASDYYALVVDHDDDDLTADQIRETYDALGVAYLAFTSASHQQNKGGVVANRWKVLLPLASAVAADRYARIAPGLALVMSADKAQTRPAQIFYAPNKVTADAPFDHIDALGKLFLDASDDNHPLVARCLAAHEAEQEKQLTAQAKAAPLKPRTGISAADGGIIEKVCNAYDMRGVLESAGYRKAGRRYLAPESSSGTPGVVMLPGDDGRERAYSHHGTDALANGYANDVFDAVCLLNYGGDVSRAVVGEAPKVDPEGQKQRQRDYMQAKAAEDAAAVVEEFTEYDNEGEKKPFSLANFSLSGQSHEMKAQMMDDTFVLDGLAIAGQITCFYAPPNAGKTLLTLRLLMDSIERGDVDGSKLFYINADDNYKGLVTKLELAEQHGFHMLAPGHGGFKSEMFAEYLEQMVKDGSASGTIIVLDTLKKFSDLMDKQASSRFMNHVREFNSHGGTVILMAHTNKNRSDDGKLIHAGTSDVVDDIDCAYMIDAMEKGPFDVTRTVKLENFKARGDVETQVSYRYSTEKGVEYQDLVDSVARVSDQEAQQAQAKDMAAQAVEKNREIIDVLFEAMGTDKVGKAELVKAVTDAGFSRRAANKVIKQHAGENWHMGHRWAETTGDNNAKFYQRIEPWQGVAVVHEDWDDDIVF